jgi:hypothetical protein
MGPTNKDNLEERFDAGEDVLGLTNWSNRNERNSGLCSLMLRNVLLPVHSNRQLLQKEKDLGFLAEYGRRA